MGYSLGNMCVLNSHGCDPFVLVTFQQPSCSLKGLISKWKKYKQYNGQTGKNEQINNCPQNTTRKA